MTDNTPFLPYGRQSIDDDDIAAVSAVLRRDFLTTGPEVAAFEDAAAQHTGARHRPHRAAQARARGPAQRGGPRDLSIGAVQAPSTASAAIWRACRGVTSIGLSHGVDM